MKAATFAFNTRTKYVPRGSAACLKSSLRAVRKGWYAAGDYVDEISLAIKKQPLKAVAIGSAVAFGIGGLAGWLAKPR
jgi:hypothetical protein